MAWVRVDDLFPEHPKIVNLSDAAFRLHISGLCYAARNLTDGAIPIGWLRLKGRRVVKTAVELVNAGVWDETTGGGYQVHDYLKYQPSRSDVTSKRDAAVVRMQSAREGRMQMARIAGQHTSQEWQDMLVAYGGVCLKCGAGNPTKDHVVPVYRGGDDSIQNLQPLCQACNSAKGRHGTDYRIGRPETRPDWLPRSADVRANKSGTPHEVRLTPSHPIPSHSQETAKTPSPRVVGGLITNSLEFEKRREFCAFVGARLEVPHKLHGDLRRQLGGADPDAKLQAWYAQVDEELEHTHEPILPTIWKWLEAKFQAWASDQAATNELEKFRPKGA